MSGKSIVGELTNRSRFDLTSCEVHAGESVVSVGDLKPGETKSLSGKVTTSPDPLLNQMAEGKFIALARIEGFSPGAQIGKEAPGGAVMLVEHLGVRP
jgi:hypothetical protein